MDSQQILECIETARQDLNNMKNPLEPIKVASALKSEYMKYKVRKDNHPEQISPLDFTVMAALEKALPMKPENDPDGTDETYTGMYRCPSCKGKFTGTGIAAHCYHCGQTLDWPGMKEIMEEIDDGR